MPGPINKTNTSVERPSQMQPIVKVHAAVAGLLLLSGCASLDNLSDKASSAATNLFDRSYSQEFNTRVYAGASAGATRLSPSTSGTRYTFSDRDSASTQLRVGVDINSLLSLEFDSSVLGAATVREVEADVSFTSLTSSALFYAVGDAANRARRVGWQGYGRLGYSLVQRASIVQPFDESGSNILVGMGAEYGFNNGLSFRGEVTRFDSDATMFGIGVVYRLGMSARQFGSVVASAAKDTISQTTNSSYEPELGAALPESAVAPGHVSLVHEGPHAALWSQPLQHNDSDADGVSDANDICQNTARNTAVSQNGCGLFDSVLSNVTFKPGAHWLSPKSRRAIDEVVDVVLAFPEAKIEVQAHADAQGPDEINQIVSAARAQAVVDYMIKQGVGEKQLVAKGYGESKPVASNDTVEGRIANRRVQLVTLPSLTPSQIAGQQSVQESSAAQPKIAVSLAQTDINALAKKAQGIRPQQVASAANSAEPSLGAALPANPIANMQLKPAVRVKGLGLGGPLRNVKFNPGTQVLQSSSNAQLAQVAKQLKLHTDVKVALLVHVSEPADNVTNLALSRDQANTLIDYFEAQGIDRRRLIAEPYGDALPVAQTVTENDRDRNRRVELRVIN